MRNLLPRVCKAIFRTTNKQVRLACSLACSLARILSFVLCQRRLHVPLRSRSSIDRSTASRISTSSSTSSTAACERREPSCSTFASTRISPMPTRPCARSSRSAAHCPMEPRPFLPLPLLYLRPRAAAAVAPLQQLDRARLPTLPFLLAVSATPNRLPSHQPPPPPPPLRRPPKARRRVSAAAVVPLPPQEALPRPDEAAAQPRPPPPQQQPPQLLLLLLVVLRVVESLLVRHRLVLRAEVAAPWLRQRLVGAVVPFRGRLSSSNT